MKKILLIILVLLLTGCSSIKIDQQEFKTTMDSKLEHMVEISEQELKDYYGIDTSKFKEFVFKVSYDEPVNIYVLVLPTNKKEAKKEIDKFFSKIEKNYDATNKKRIQNKYFNTIDDYLVYIVSNNGKFMYNDIKMKYEGQK